MPYSPQGDKTDDRHPAIRGRAHELLVVFEQLEAVFESAPVGIAIYGPDLRLERVNARLADWWNLTDAEQATGQHPRDIAPMLWPVLEPAFRDALAGRRADLEMDRRQYGISYGPRYVHSCYTPLRSGETVIGVAATVSDVSESVTASREAAAAIAFRDDLISVASHELRTPLTSILGMSQRLERLAGSSARSLAESHDDLALISGESERMARTLDVLLDMVGLASGTAGIQSEPVALPSLIRRQVRMVQERHPALRVETCFLDDAIVDTDGDRVAQVVSNLLENAARHAGANAHVSVRVRCDGHAALVEVQDDGPGIAPGVIERVFERRYRGTSSRGLGLGLYLSRMIARRLGGELTVASTPGEGATFTFRLA